MNFKLAHNNINVLDLERSMNFYSKALGLVETSRKDMDGFTLVYLGDRQTPHKLELTWMKDRKTAYDLGENEFHLAFITDDMEKAHTLHKEMNCICYENKAMNLYFIQDPDGYWLEIMPER
ncbi:VOC family protein [Pelosinus baikalensis]|uniref:VOC family protein n=1 Tax=Pelosinus baikalensis TaxID=2892015 RepID=A0ABS8I0F2_9FIRM|nr:VOC family protein [Pelosinus baikalensis]